MEISKFESLQGWRFGRKDVWVDKRKQVRKEGPNRAITSVTHVSVIPEYQLCTVFHFSRSRC